MPFEITTNCWGAIVDAASKSRKGLLSPSQQSSPFPDKAFRGEYFIERIDALSAETFMQARGPVAEGFVGGTPFRSNGQKIVPIKPTQKKARIILDCSFHNEYLYQASSERIWPGRGNSVKKRYCKRR